MLQQCPQCLTLLQTENAADGQDKIRCTHCGYLLDTGAASRPTPAQDDTLSGQVTDASAMLTAADRIALYEDGTMTTAGGNSVAWTLACMLMAMILALQIVYFKRNQLLTMPSWQPVIESMCQMFHCRIQLPHDLSQIRIIGRDVRSHPTINNALAISVTLENTAPFRQAFPDLRLRFSDRQGKILASRRFTPAEYLGKTVRINEGMPSHTPVQGNLLIVDPGRNAVNFEFEFF